ncbi:MAG: GldG family protein [Alphaproteobacteria bacterium]|nr:GldG family protein [Alphaproteobacteria bacterium]MBU0866209.1 GldG family protein [Alphaproteobacteria bacterium]MBU1826138.1 GldG family protein [Alphaproteobacteria bacterium]
MVVRAVSIAALVALLAWIGGGQVLLDRIDPALALPLLILPMLLLAVWQRREGVDLRRSTLVMALALVAGAQTLLAVSLSGSAGGLQITLVLVAGAAAGWVADRLVRWRPRVRWLPWFAGLALVIGWFTAGHMLLAALYRPAAASTGTPATTMLTGLPLRWSGNGDIAAIISGGAEDDPALVQLEAMGPVSLVDSLVDHVPPPGGALLIAHPRALAPQELVAIDAFVRGGGKAVVLADALSGWPAPHPLGDPRNPPVTSLLTPLLDHWGVTLGAAPTDDNSASAADVDGARLRLSSAGAFERLPPTCRSFAGRRIAQCRIGAGEAWLVGDADLLFAPLWSPLVPGADHLRQADTIAWLAARLWPGAGVAVLQPLWIRAHAD